MSSQSQSLRGRPWTARRQQSRPTVASLPTSAKPGRSRWERPSRRPASPSWGPRCGEGTSHRLREAWWSWVLPSDTPSSCEHGRRSACRRNAVQLAPPFHVCLHSCQPCAPHAAPVRVTRVRRCARCSHLGNAAGLPWRRAP